MGQETLKQIEEEGRKLFADTLTFLIESLIQKGFNQGNEEAQDLINLRGKWLDLIRKAYKQQPNEPRKKN